MRKKTHPKNQKQAGDTRKNVVAPTPPARNELWLYGKHAVVAALQNPARRHKRLLCTKQHSAWLERFHLPSPLHAELAEAEDFSRLFPEDATHQGIALLTSPLPAASGLSGLSFTRPVMILDQVTDPHNIGAILRSAAAFGIEAVITAKDHAPRESAAMAKAASGGLELVPFIAVTNLARAMEELKSHGYWLIGMDGNARSPFGGYQAESRTGIVMGAEGKGLRTLTARLCDLMLHLPIHPQMESLNVSNAAAIAMYEVTRSCGVK